MTRATLYFACGAKMEVKDLPSPAELRSSMKHCRQRNGMPAVRTAQSGGETISVPRIGTRVPSCLWDCPRKRESGRKEYQCFPEDYETAKAKYAGKSFYSISVRTASCFPVRIVRRRKR